MNKKEINNWFAESISEIQSLYITPKYLNGTAKHFQSLDFDKDMISINVEHSDYDKEEDKRRNKGEVKGSYKVIPDNYIFSFLEASSNCIPINFLDYPYHLSREFTRKLSFSGSIARAMLNFIGAPVSKGEWNNVFNNHHYNVDIKFTRRNTDIIVFSFKVTNKIENITHTRSVSREMDEFKSEIRYFRIYNFSPSTVRIEYEKRMAEIDDEIRKEENYDNSSTGCHWRDAYGDQVDDPGFNADC